MVHVNCWKQKSEPWLKVWGLLMSWHEVRSGGENKAKLMGRLLCGFGALGD